MDKANPRTLGAEPGLPDPQPHPGEHHRRQQAALAERHRLCLGPGRAERRVCGPGRGGGPVAGSGALLGLCTHGLNTECRPRNVSHKNLETIFAGFDQFFAGFELSERSFFPFLTRFPGISRFSPVAEHAERINYWTGSWKSCSGLVSYQDQDHFCKSMRLIIKNFRGLK